MSDLFNTDDPDNTDNGDTEVPKFEDLVGEDKKFKDTDAVAHKIFHSDRHISNLETELSELRTELKSRLTVEDMLGKLEKRPEPSEPPKTEETREMSPNNARQEPGSDETNQEVNVEEKFKKLIEAEKAKDLRDTNLNNARTSLKEMFGSDYNQKLVEIAGELEVSKEFLTDLAASSPSGFMGVIKSVAKPDDTRPATPPSGSFDPSKTRTGETRRNSSYYAELRKSDPNTYYSRKVQNEMHSEALKQGSNFYS